MKAGVAFGAAWVLLAINAGWAQVPSASAASPPPALEPGAITRTLNAQLTVSSLEVAVPFYRDVLGLEVTPGTACCSGVGGYVYRDRLAPGRGGSPAAANPGNAAAPATRGAAAGPPGGIAGLTGVVNGMPRFVRMNVPGQTWKIQLIEMTNVERRPVNPRRQDVGAAGLILYVRDLDVTLAALKKTRTPIVTTGGQPVHFEDGNTKGRAIVARDPDGLSIEVRQLDHPPAGAVPGSGNVIDVAMSVSVRNTDQTVHYWHDLLNFDLQPAAKFSRDKSVLALYGTPNAEVRKTKAHLAGSPVQWEFLEFKNIDRRELMPRVQDPGNAAFVLLTDDVEAFFNRLKGTPNTKILSTEDGISAPFTPPANGANGALFFQDLNGFIIEACKGCGIGQR